MERPTGMNSWALADTERSSARHITGRATHLNNTQQEHETASAHTSACTHTDAPPTRFRDIHTTRGHRPAKAIGIAPGAPEVQHRHMGLSLTGSRLQKSGQGRRRPPFLGKTHSRLIQQDGSERRD